jgi:hypothetical protein
VAQQGRQHNTGSGTAGKAAQHRQWHSREGSTTQAVAQQRRQCNAGSGAAEKAVQHRQWHTLRQSLLKLNISPFYPVMKNKYAPLFVTLLPLFTSMFIKYKVSEE